MKSIETDQIFLLIFCIFLVRLIGLKAGIKNFLNNLENWLHSYFFI